MAALEGGEASWVKHGSGQRGWCDVERTYWTLRVTGEGSQRDKRSKQKDTELGGDGARL